MGKDCKAPESIPGIPQEILNFFGETIDVIAENRIFDHYCLNQSVNEFTSIFPKRNHDGTQVFRDVTGLNTMLFISYLKENNPHIDEKALSKQALMKGGGIKIPDWAIHRVAKLNFEYYEVKPNSTASIGKGDVKILFLIALCGLNKLPYLPVTAYNPNQEETLWIENKGFIQTEVSLHWFRLRPGLLVYEVCVQRRPRNPVPQKVTKALVEVGLGIAAMLAMRGRGGRIPIPR